MSLTLLETREKGQSGYFRIGHVTLDIPPESIVTNKVTNSEEIAPLRSKHTMHQKTGHSRWDVTISWKALMDPTSAAPYKQWDTLRTVYAIFRAAPFVEVENGYLRQLLLPNADDSQRMAFALRQLRIDTIPDITDGLQATLTMSWFNYKPYSADFGYLSDQNTPTDAYLSGQFASYIRTWIEENLDTAYDPLQGDPALSAKYAYPEVPEYRLQTPGLLTLRWRNYQALPMQDAAATVSTTTRSTGIPATGLPAAGRITSAFGVRKDPITGKTTSHAGIDIAAPTGTAVHAAADGKVAKVNTDGIGGGYGNYIDIDHGGALISHYAHLSSVSVYRGQVVKAGQVIGAVGNTGKSTGSHLHYEVRKNGKPVDPQIGIAKLTSDNTPAADASPLNKAAGATPSGAAPVQEIPDAVKAAARQLLDAGWQADHWTERAVFLFEDQEMAIADNEHGSNNSGLYASQISMVFVNNLVTMPLSGHQYPTMQHIGPAGTMIVVGMQSLGMANEGLEPAHPGLSQLADMASSLESQYLRLRGEWRAVVSVHRMQAVILENQVLNAFGIHGTLCNGLSTENVEGSPLLMQGALKLSQYENIFEVVKPFRVKGVTGAYREVLDGVLNDGTLDRLIKQANPDGGNGNQVLNPLKQYTKDRQNRNLVPVCKMLEDKTYLAPRCGMPVALSQEQMDVLKAAINKLAVTPTNMDASVVGWVSGGASGSFAASHPDIAKAVETNSFSYNDYVRIVVGLAADPNIAALRAQIDPLVAQSPDDPLLKLYDALLDYQSRGGEPGVALAVQELQQVPEVRARYKNAVAGQGPGLDEDNKEHGAYRDMGLKTINVGGKDLNPGYYFNESRLDPDVEKMAKYAAQIAGQAVNEFAKKNSTAPVPAQPSDNTFQTNEADSDALLNAEATCRAILEKTNISQRSMKKAFPTFKLMLAEECNDKPFFMFDNFYSYGSVMSIEVEKYQDKPDLAVIQLTNFSNLLSHRAFDGSALGRQERNYSNLQALPTSNAGPVAGQGQMAFDAEKDVFGLTRTGLNLSSDLGKGIEAPLQYYPLQTGAKIQVRMGYSNNPDELYPVFQGTVTQIEGGEMLTIVAQGFLFELMNTPDDELTTDGYLNLSTASGLITGVATSIRDIPEGMDAIYNLINSLGKGAAFGGWRLFREAGDTPSVMEAVLKVSTAKHFGRWQINPGRQASPFVKGFSWLDLPAAVAPNIATAVTLATGFDRRGENIHVNRYINVDGSQLKNSPDRRLCRGMEFEKPLSLLNAEYHVPNDFGMTPWRIIKDIGRRYPNYITAVRGYGYPFGADATLVFAHPNDLYISRRALADEAEFGRHDQSANRDFNSWWTTAGGAALMQVILDNSGFTEAFLKSMVTSLKIPQASNESPGKAVVRWVGGVGVSAFDSVCEALRKNVQAGGSLKIFNAVFTLFGHDPKAKADRVLKDVAAMQMRLQNHLTLAQVMASGGNPNAPRPGDRIQPVRRWHLVTRDDIVSNGIRINDTFCNAVRVDKKIMYANAHMPSQYRRILDADSLIIMPEMNARSGGADVRKAYQQSFLRDELGKMYEGDLVLLGRPEIEPFDVILMYDPTTTIAGPIEVASVVHSFDQEMGSITIVRPKAMVIVNDATTAGILASLSDLHLIQELRGGWGDLTQNHAVQLGAAVEAGKTAAEAAAVTAAAVGAGMVTGFTAPVTVPVLFGAALVTVVSLKLCWLADDKQSSNPVFVSPLTRFGKPWVGGLDGWQMTDMHTLIRDQFQQMWNAEIAPTLESFRIVNQLLS